MAMKFAWGWELGAGLTFYTGAGWASSGSPYPREASSIHQHAKGYGGGRYSLRCATGAYLETPSVYSVTPTGTVNTTCMAGTTWTAGGELLRVVDSLGASMLAVKMVDAEATSRLAVLHAGVTAFTTAARLSLSTWYRLALHWTVSGGTIAPSLYVDGQLRGSGSTPLTTGVTAAGLRWCGASNGNTYHDHTVVHDAADAITRRETWLQGLQPNADDVLGPWAPSSGPNLYSALTDANDGTWATTGGAGAFRVRMQGRTDIHASWTAPTVLAVQSVVAGNGDGALPNGRTSVTLGGSSVAGSTVAMPAAGGLAWALATSKPGGGAWAATDLDNTELTYEVA